MTSTLEGVYPVLATTFAGDGTLDLDSQMRLVDHLLEGGADGLGLFGIASEGYTLSNDERTRILRLVAAQVNGRVPLVVSSGHTGTDVAVRLSREAQDLGASAVMVLPPYLLRPDSDGLMFYFDAISRALDVPIMVQDAPLLTQVTLPASLLARMAREIEHVRYVKVEAPPTAPKVSAVRDAAGETLTVFGGLNGQFLIEEFERGARGAMPGSDLIEAFACIWAALRRGDRPSAWRNFSRALPLIRFELQPGMGVSAMKHNLAARGVIGNARVRHPTLALDPQSLSELDALRKLMECA